MEVKFSVRLLWTPVLCLVIADGKCWEPEQIVMEKQDNSIASEIVTNECTTWVVSYCSTFVTQVEPQNFFMLEKTFKII